MNGERSAMKVARYVRRGAHVPTRNGWPVPTLRVEEIIQSSIGSAILNNTATKLILQQQGDTKILKETLRLNPQETRLIAGLERKKGQFSEAFLMKGDARQVLRIVPSPLEYWISTSDAADNAYLQKFIQKGMGLQEAVLAAAKAAPFGVEALQLVNPSRDSGEAA